MSTQYINVHGHPADRSDARGAHRPGERAGGRRRLRRRTGPDCRRRGTPRRHDHVDRRDACPGDVAWSPPASISLPCHHRHRRRGPPGPRSHALAGRHRAAHRPPGHRPAAPNVVRHPDRRLRDQHRSLELLAGLPPRGRRRGDADRLAGAGERLAPRARRTSRR